MKYNNISISNALNEALNESALTEKILANDPRWKTVNMTFEVSFLGDSGEEENISSVSSEELEEVYEYIQDEFNSKKHPKDISIGSTFRGNFYNVTKADINPKNIYWDTEKQMEINIDKYK